MVFIEDVYLKRKPNKFFIVVTHPPMEVTLPPTKPPPKSFKPGFIGPHSFKMQESMCLGATNAKGPETYHEDMRCPLTES
jgi:hypothetical protein